MEETNPELESFRQQWRAEVTARSKVSTGASSSVSSHPVASGSRGHRKKSSVVSPSSHPIRSTDEQGDIEPKTYHDLENREDAFRLGVQGDSSEARELALKRREEPSSALEHYERAVEREDQGKLGESLSHYRKAYRLDPSIDKTYKAMHYPPSSQPPPASISTSKPRSSTSGAAPTAQHSNEDPSAPNTIKDDSTTALILSFASLSIPALSPPHTSSPPPYAPLTDLPTELLLLILSHLATTSPSSLPPTALVCRKVSYLIHTSDRLLYKPLIEGPTHGLGGMHTSYACTLLGTPLSPSSIPTSSTPPLTLSLSLTPGFPTYLSLYRHHPRIHFPGIYISTVNYVRPGAASQGQVTWNTPVLVVTYYRYLRFFRNGTCLSLLTTSEPADVVHSLNFDTVAIANAGGAGGIPGVAAVKGALRGRWRIAKSGDHDPSDDVATTTTQTTTMVPGRDEDEELQIETEGTSPKYMYKMHFALKGTGGRRGMGGKKLVWRGFWSYNHLTGDWGEFGLRNDRAFFWSRVRSYGLGG